MASRWDMKSFRDDSYKHVLVFFCQLSGCTWIFWYFNYRLLPHDPQSAPLSHGPSGLGLVGLPVLLPSSAMAVICRFKLSIYYFIYQDSGVKGCGENMLTQRSCVATSWTCFLARDTTRDTSFPSFQNQKEAQTLFPAFSFLVVYSIHIAGFSMANSISYSLAPPGFKI